MFRIKSIAFSVALLASASVMASPITVIAYSSITGPNLKKVDFEDLGAVASPNLNKNLDGLVTSDGATFGASFQGQVLSSGGPGTATNFDVLSDSTTGGALTLVADAAGHNLAEVSTMIPGTLNAITGVGNLGYGPTGSGNTESLGEGSVAIKFATAQSSFGIEALLVNGNSTMTVDFFRADGSLIGTQVVNASLGTGPLATNYYGFATTDGVADIAGISITNTDFEGLVYDNLVFSAPDSVVTAPVPEPATNALMLAGLAALGAVMRKRRSIRTNR